MAKENVITLVNTSDSDIVDFPLTVDYEDKFNEKNGQTEKLPVNKRYSVKAKDTLEIPENEFCYFNQGKGRLSWEYLKQVYPFLMKLDEVVEEESRTLETGKEFDDLLKE